MEELEHKIMTKKRFSKAVEACVSQKRMSYIDSITYVIEERGMDFRNIKKLLSDSIKQKLEAEAIGLNLINVKKKNSLPL
jgi:DNA-directed RNA polymerase alpha subunit